MKKYAFFLGCNIPIRIQQYASSTKAVLKNLGVETKHISDFNCCGYPVRNIDEKSFLFSSARNMALAEEKGFDILVMCNCCFQSLKTAKNTLSKDKGLLNELNEILAKKGLKYQGTVKIKHFLSIIYHDIGIDFLKQSLIKTFNNLNIAVIYGCHILRPHEITRFDNPFVPSILDELVEATGACSIDWQGKLECCGASLTGINDKLSIIILKEKLDAAKNAGADCIISVCSFCHIQFDTVQKNICAEDNELKILPAILYPQLLGLCMGIDEKILGIEQNKTIKIKKGGYAPPFA